MENSTTTTTVTTNTGASWPGNLDPALMQEEYGGWNAVRAQSDVTMSEEDDDDSPRSLSSGGSSNPSVQEQDQDPNYESSMVITVKARLSSSYYFLRKLGAGCFGVVYAIVSRDLADSTIAGLTDGMPNEAAYDLLKKNTLAVKIASSHYFGPRTVTKDMSMEIDTMKKVGDIQNVMRMVDYDKQGRLWYKMPLVQGSYTLVEFYERFCDPDLEHSADFDVQVSKALTFHLLAQLAEAVVSLHGKSITHGDLQPQNILLSKALRHGAYPGLVVVDFGCARVWNTRDLPSHISPKFKAAKFRVEKNDAFVVLDTFAGLANRSGENTFFRSASSNVALTHNSEEVQATLRDIACEARQKAESLRQPMLAALDDWLSTSSISDENLKQTIAEIRATESRS